MPKNARAYSNLITCCIKDQHVSSVYIRNANGLSKCTSEPLDVTKIVLNFFTQSFNIGLYIIKMELNLIT